MKGSSQLDLDESMRRGKELDAGGPLNGLFTLAATTSEI